MNILIVEDEAIIAESLYQLLRLLEYAPYEPVGHADDALAIIRNEPPDLVILDLTLQNGSSGVDVAAFIHNEKLNIPFIVLTAHSDVNTIKAVKKYQPSAYLVKPFMREALFAAIELALPEGEEETEEDGEIFLKTGVKYEKLDLQELVYIKANGKYTELHFTFGKRLIRMPLSTFISKNQNIKFLRVHRAYAVNPEYIHSFTADEIKLDQSKVPIGRFFAPSVNSYLRTRSFKK